MNDATSTYFTIANTECTGVFCQRICELQPYHNAPNYISYQGDYHIFAKYEDKVYMEVRNVGEIMISFAELQKNKYWKYYYYLSLMLTNNKHKVIKNNTFNKLYNQIYRYTEDRVWSFKTAYIDQSDMKNFKIKQCENVCYYKINPFNLEKMEYSTKKELEVFELGYMNGLERVKNFLHRSVIYKNIALEYQVSKMEKEIDELSVFFEDKKNVINLVATFNVNDEINNDILMIIYNNLVGVDVDRHKKYKQIITELGTHNQLESIAEILSI